MRPRTRDLFGAFMTISVSAFGGALPWARFVMVEKRHWLSDVEFNDVLAFCQFLPGPNIVNIAIVVGARFRGPLGASAALFGLLLPAFCIVVTLGALYSAYGRLDSLRDLFTGIAAAAAGLIVAMTEKMALPLVRRRALTSLPFFSAAFIMVGLLNWPLGWVLLCLAPMSIAARWWSKR